VLEIDGSRGPEGVQGSPATQLPSTMNIGRRVPRDGSLPPATTAASDPLPFL
jgi:hypothetical protein